MKNILKADTNEKSEKSASGIFNMIRKEPSPIIRNVESPKKIIRKDYRGTLIQKGSKNHKVTFLDQVSKLELIEEVKVDSFKEFNTDMSYGNENCACRCSLV